MKPTFLFFLALLVLSSAHGQSASSPVPTIQVNVRLINVFVNVTDPQGAPVARLDKNDFLLFEDGRRQDIAVFERQSGLPLNIVLAIDTSGSVRKDLEIEQEAARHFADAILRPIDRLDVMEFSDDVREVVSFTNNKSRIDHALHEMRGGSATAFYSGIYLAAQRLNACQGRKVLVLISDGGNTVKGTTYQQALEEAVRSEVIVYSIIDVPVAASAGRDLAGEHAMITLSQETGGKYYYADSSTLERSFQQISADLRTQYLLGYYPSSHDDNSGFRNISVNLSDPAAAGRYTVHNRAGYYPGSR